MHMVGPILGTQYTIQLKEETSAYRLVPCYARAGHKCILQQRTWIHDRHATKHTHSYPLFLGHPVQFLVSFKYAIDSVQGDK